MVWNRGLVIVLPRVARRSLTASRGLEAKRTLMIGLGLEKLNRNGKSPDRIQFSLINEPIISHRKGSHN